MKADGLGAKGAADAVAMNTPLVHIERASPENAIHVSLMIETLLFAVRDEPIASGVASHLRVRGIRHSNTGCEHGANALFSVDSESGHSHSLQRNSGSV